MRLKHAAQQISSSRPNVQLASELAESIRQFDGEAGRHQRVLMIEFLESAKKVIDDNGLTECPVCERSIDVATLSARLQSRFDADVRMTTLRLNVAGRQATFLKSIQTSFRALSELIADWEKELREPVPEPHCSEAALLLEITQKLTSTYRLSDVTGFAAKLGQCPENSDELVNVLDRLANPEEGGQTRTALSEASAMFASLAAHWSTYVGKCAAQKRLNQQCLLALRVHEHAVSSRKAVVEELLNGISTTANSMYEFIHPNENISGSSLTVRAKNLFTIF